MRAPLLIQCHGDPNRRQRLALPQRDQGGVQLVEMLTAVVVGSIFMAAMYGSASAMYATSASSENQVLASNMAQQVIDNARDCSYQHLLTLLGGSSTVNADLPLYDYPSTPSSALFPRPLLRNESSSFSGQYSQQAKDWRFNGTVTETLQNLNPGATSNGSIRVTVLVAWSDGRGPHNYQVATTISQDGIHN